MLFLLLVMFIPDNSRDHRSARYQNQYRQHHSRLSTARRKQQFPITHISFKHSRSHKRDRHVQPVQRRFQTLTNKEQTISSLNFAQTLRIALSLTLTQ